MKGDLLGRVLQVACFIFGFVCIGLTIYYTIARLTQDWFVASITQIIPAICYFYSYSNIKRCRKHYMQMQELSTFLKEL